MSRRNEIQDATGVIRNMPGIGILQAAGTTVPSDGAAGYAPGCMFHHVDGASGTTNYQNEGSNTSADFNAVVLPGVDLSSLTATAAEVNRTSDASARMVTTTATALSLTVTEHAERVLLVNTNSTVANTFTLPASAGTGETFTVINNVVQTQGTVVVAAAGSDVMQGFCVAIDSTAGGGTDTFATTATSDKISLNLTTTGGLGGDKVVARDLSAGTWHVEVVIAGSGSLATPFSQT